MSFKQSMGQTAVFSIHGRSKEDDKYREIFKTVHGSPMSRFKHETYAYSLNRYHKEYKSLYLYNGYTRIAKAIILGTDTLELTFKSKEYAEEWDKTEEQINSAMVDIPWLQRNFSQKWIPSVSNNDSKRIFKKEN